MQERDRFRQFLILLVFILMVGMRIIHPMANPPEEISWGSGEFTDPGVYATNARNKILFGDWGISDEKSIFISPLSTFSLYLIFKVFGIGILQSRLLPIFFGLLTIILFYLTIRRVESKEIAYLATGLLGFNYTFIIYNRLSIPETPMIFFLLLSIYLLLSQKRYSLFFGGMSWSIALTFKASAFLFLPVIAVAIIAPSFLSEKKISKILDSLFWSLGGIILPILLYIILFAWPYLGEIVGSHLSTLAARTGKSLPFILYKMPRIFGYEFFRKIPFITFFSNLYLLYLFDRIFKKRWQEISFFELLNLVWLLSGYLSLSLLSYYRPQRYFIYLFLPLSFFAAKMLTRICKEDPDKLGRPNILLYIIFGGANYIMAVFARDHFIDIKWLSIGLRIAIEIAFFFLFLAFLTVSLFFGYYHRIRVNQRIAIGLFLGMLPFLSQFYQYINWAIHPSYSIIEASEDLGKRLDDAVIAGFWAKALSLENKHRVISLPPQKPGEGEEETLKREGITHLLLEEEEAKRYFPKTLKKASLLREYKIGRDNIRLYKLNLAQNT